MPLVLSNATKKMVLDAQSAAVEKERAEAVAKLQDLQDRFNAGKATWEEKQELEAIANAAGLAVADVVAAFTTYLGPAMASATAQIGEAMAALGGTLKLPVLTPLDRARKNLANGKELDRWTTEELMAFLPPKAHELEKLNQQGQLTNLQLACIAQHCLNNCSNKDAITYDGALQHKYAPELIKRVARTERQSVKAVSVKMQTAWALYRSGAATLEEITPLMDQAAELGEKEDT